MSKDTSSPYGKFILVPRGQDPNDPQTGDSRIRCASIRTSRARKEARKHYGTRLYVWSSARSGYIPISMTVEPSDRRFRSASNIVGDSLRVKEA